AAGADDRHHDFEVRLLLGRVLLDGDATAIVADGEAAVRKNVDVDVLAIPGQVFVDGVVDEFVDEVMQTTGGRIGNVVIGPLADVGGISQDLGVLSGVIRFGSFGDSDIEAH